METLIPEKAYFRIGEVSKILEVEPYVIRYWESEFHTVKPVRTRTAQRLYRRKDVQELLIIRDLLYTQRFTIDGARKQLVRLRGEQDTLTVSVQDDKEKLKTIKQSLQEIRAILS